MIKKIINNYLFKQKGFWFVLLLNLKAKIKRSDAHFSFQINESIYKIKSIKLSDPRELFFKHEHQGGSTYIDGIYKRGESIGNIYFLNKIHFSSGDVIFDCGANLGDLLIWFQNRDIEVKYIGFEPSPEEFTCLEKNTLNHRIHQVALWKEEGYKKFFLSSQNADSSLIKPSAFDEIVNVKAKKLESYVTQKIKLLKLEAEGAELEVLIGLEKKQQSKRCN